MNTNDDSNLYWWITTILCAIWSTWQARKLIGKEHIVADLEFEIAERDKIINQKDEIIEMQQKLLNKYINDNTGGACKLE